MKKAAAEASMQRSKKARMVELFVVRYHVMCPDFSVDACLRFCVGWSRRTSVLTFCVRMAHRKAHRRDVRKPKQNAELCGTSQPQSIK